MTLGNMRELGVRSLAVTCELCHHEAVLPADDWPDAMLVRDVPAAHGVHPVRDRRRRRAAELAGDAGQREVANSPSAYDCYDQVGNLKEQH